MSSGGCFKGNTAQLIESFVQGAEDAGHHIEVVSLLKDEVKGCLGCIACRYGKPCVPKDAFHAFVPKIKTTDLIVFASPLYFWTLSSRIKTFIERFYCIAEEDPAPPLGRYEKYPLKDAALLMIAADGLFWAFEQAVSCYRFAVINYIGFRDKGMLLAGGCGDDSPQPPFTLRMLPCGKTSRSLLLRAISGWRRRCGPDRYGSVSWKCRCTAGNWHKCALMAIKTNRKNLNLQGADG